MSESEPTQIGDIIRQRRAELGLSPAELGELIGRTGSTVRRWEKNEAAPPGSLLAKLATALDLEQGQLKAALKSSGAIDPPPAREKELEAQAPVAETETKPRQPEPEPEPEPEAEAEAQEPVAEPKNKSRRLSTPDPEAQAKAPEPATAKPPEPAKTAEPEAENKASEPEARADPPPTSSPPPVQRPASTKQQVSAMSEDRPPSAPPRSASPAPIKQPPPQPVPPSDVGVHTQAASGTEAITELPTEVMAVPSPEPTAEPGVVSRPARTRTIQRPQEAALSYVEDPAQRYRYFLRWLLTAVAIVVMLFVLAWAFTELKEALGDVWDLFQQEPSETTIVGADLSGG